MIKYYKNCDIDIEKWDKCISKSLNSAIYAHSWYLNVVADDWDALIEDDYDSVMPLVFKKKFGILYIYPPFFTQQLGVFSKNIITSQKLEDFINSIPKHFKYIEMHLNNENIFKIERSYLLIKNKNFILNLNTDYNSLSANYSENLKRNLKKAEKFNLKVVENVKPDDIINLFRKNKGRELKHLGRGDYKRLNRLFYDLINLGLVKTYGIYSPENNLIAGAIFFFYRYSSIFIFSAIDQDARKLFAMPKIIDNFIRKLSDNQLFLDFEGSNDYNLARFYKSFGAKEVNYYTIIINRLPMLTKIAFLLFKKIKLLLISK